MNPEGTERECRMKKLLIVIIVFLVGVMATAERNTSVAFILRTQDSELDLQVLKKSVEATLSISITEPLVEEKSVITFKNNDNLFLISRMPFGVPQEEVRSALSSSLLIKNKSGIAEGQKAHLVVSVSSESATKIQNRLLLTKLVSAILNSSDSVGVYWGSAGQVIQPDIFLSFAKSADEKNLPIPLWLSFTVGKGEKGETNFFSTGMKDLGYFEFEVIDLKMNWEDCYYFLLDFTNYFITSGDKIADGDTIGRDENEKIKVKYLKSELTDDPTVMRIFM